MNILSLLSKKTRLNKITKILIRSIQVLFLGWVTMGAESCQPVEVVAYKPTSVEEQNFLTNQWCGYDMATYPNIPNTKIKTLYKVKLDVFGRLNIASVTQAQQYFIKQNFNLTCNFTAQSQMRCDGQDVSYQPFDQYVVTDMLLRFFPGLVLTQLSLCSGNQLGEF